MLEDGGAVVAKFYRPGRWSDAQILEEHGFAPGAGRRRGAGGRPAARCTTRLRRARCCLTLPGRPRWRCARGPWACTATRVSPRRPAGRPSWRTTPCWSGWAASSAGCMRSARAGPSRTGARWTRRTMRARPRALLLERRLRQRQPARALGRGLRARPSTASTTAFAAHVPRPIRLHGDCHPGNLLWRDAGAHCRGPRRRLHRPGRAGPVDAAVGRAARPWRGSCGCCCAATRRSWTSTGASCALIEPLRTLRMIHHNAWVAQRWQDPAFPARLPVIRQLGATGASRRAAARAAARAPPRRPALGRRCFEDQAASSG